MNNRRTPILVLVAVILAGGALSAYIVYGSSLLRNGFPGLDVSARNGSETVDRSEIKDVLPRDAIPAITEPRFVPASSAPWKDRDAVLGVVIGGDARAYPVRVLNWHEIVDDRVGGVPVAVTFCPLCATGIVFDRRAEGRTLTFGVSGKLYRNDLVMYDRETDSLWTQVLGEAISGPLAGSKLRQIPVAHVSWGEWRRLYPRAKVLSKRTGFERDYDSDPYLGYLSSSDIGIFGDKEADPRLDPKALVIGVAIREGAAAFPVRELDRLEVIESDVAGVPVVVFYDPESTLAAVFDRRVGGRRLSFKRIGRHRAVDAQTRTVWSTVDGRALDGELKGKKLRPVTATRAFWFAWADFHKDTIVAGPEKK